MKSDNEQINYESIADQFDLEQFSIDEYSINLGTVDETLQNLGIAIEQQDEYTVDEINIYLEARGMRMIEQHTQLFLIRS